MFDQTFSPENLQIISDIEGRRGSNLDAAFFPDVEKAIDELKARISETKNFRKTRKSPYSTTDQEIFEGLREKREVARKNKDEVLLNCLQKVSREISRKNYRVEFERKIGPGGKHVYVVADEPSHYYAIKQLIRNLARLYKLKPANRNLIVSQLSHFLRDGFPYHVIKLDISNFFESIDQAQIIQKLVDDQLLSSKSLIILKNILWKYSNIAGTPNFGLPRGIGVSSYLSELFMKDFDRKISNMSEVVFYARYVDDIILIFAPSKMSDVKKYLSNLTTEIEKKNLKLNDAKTKEFATSDKNWSFEYLGYAFVKSEKKNSKIPEVYLSEKKFNKYLSRLHACYKKHEQQRPKNQKAAFRLLIKRIQYITGNTQLSHSKENAYVGIYFGSPHLTNLRQLKILDYRLKKYTKALTSKKLKDRLAQYSFVSGYTEKIYRRFHRRDEFKKIIKAWKYGN